MSALDPIARDAPLLGGRSVASQRWSDLAFLHWRVDADRVAPLLPPGVRPDVFDGTSWVGLIPFRLDRATLFGGPPMPYVGDFVEVNVRLYGVDDDGRRGVVFLTLEASRLAAVLAARAAFGLPYRWARTRLVEEGGVVTATSRRHGGGPASLVRVRLRDPIVASPLDDFLTARWGMFTRRRGRTVFLRNEHAAWELRAAELLELDDQLMAACGLPGLAERPPESVLFSRGVVTRFAAPG